MVGSETQNPLIASYGRRRGRKLKAGREALWEEVLPLVRLVLPESGGIDLQQVFPESREVWLEIGFGGGEHLAAQAAAHPCVGMIGCEPYRDGVIKLLRAVDREGLENVRVFPDDARLLLERLPEASLSRVFILFPDPWPKARHHKRRIVNPQTLALLARVLRPGGELRLATDHADYADWMLEQLMAEPRFEWTARCADDFRVVPDDWVPTRYQIKTEKEGRNPVFLIYRRCPAEG